jgi:GT2 family glycosyltransferase
MTAPAAGTPLVSVVIPVFNGAATIARTLDSVLRQTLEDFELLVIDDGSTDDTARIVSAVTDPRVRLLSFENRGLAASRNRGVRHGRGEFVAFIDADDLWAPDKLARQVEAMRRDPAVAVVYSWSDCIDERDEFLDSGTRIFAAGRVYEKLLAGNFMANGSTALVRTSAFASAGLFDEQLAAAEDWDMWLRLAWQFPFACVPEVHVWYRVHGSAMSSNVPRQAAACLQVFENALARLPPSTQRDRVERAGRAVLYRYFTGRVLRTAAGRSDGRLAASYWWRFARLGSLADGDLGPALAQLVRIVLLLLLPEALSRPLLRASFVPGTRRGTGPRGGR